MTPRDMDELLEYARGLVEQAQEVLNVAADAHFHTGLAAGKALTAKLEAQELRKEAGRLVEALEIIAHGTREA